MGVGRQLPASPARRGAQRLPTRRTHLILERRGCGLMGASSSDPSSPSYSARTGRRARRGSREPLPRGEGPSRWPRCRQGSEPSASDAREGQWASFGMHKSTCQSRGRRGPRSRRERTETRHHRKRGPARAPVGLIKRSSSDPQRFRHTRRRRKEARRKRERGERGRASPSSSGTTSAGRPPGARAGECTAPRQVD